MNNLYIDVGSTYIKYAVNDGAIGCIAFPAPSRADGYIYEIAVESIVQKVARLIDESGADNVFFSVQMHGYILSDGDHRPVTHYVSWRDTLFRKLGTAFPFSLPEESGTAIKNNLPALSIYARSKLCPEVLQRAVYFDTLGSYIVYRLTGANMVHITDACPTGFYLLPQGRLNAALVQEPCFRRLRFPTAVTEVCVAGQYRGADVYVSVGDQQASALGVGLTTDEYLVNTGTAGQICCLSDRFVSGAFESRPYFDGKTLCTVSGLVGGVCTDADADEQKMKEEYESVLKKLPPRRRMISTGGAVKYNEAMFERICKSIVSDYAYVDAPSTVAGLKKIARQICKTEKAES